MHLEADLTWVHDLTRRQHRGLKISKFGNFAVKFEFFPKEKEYSLDPGS